MGEARSVPLMDTILRTMRVRRASAVCECPVCGRRVTDRDERVRLRGTSFVHRRCATYRVRQMSRGQPRSASVVR
jgi:predicted RNA-binding Zn-ribbon protein involved in translation (DUF1610 family)